MAVNKVNLANGETLVDLTGDSVNAETLAEGTTAHDASGNPIIGKMPTTNVLYTEQTLTEEQKAQARKNIGISDNLAAISSISIEYGRYEGASYYIARIPKYTVDGKRLYLKVAITSEDGSVDVNYDLITTNRADLEKREIKEDT